MSKTKAAAPAGSFRQTLSELLKARHPVLLIESYEEDRVVDEITAVARDPNLVRTPRQVRLWSATTGLAAPGETGPAGTRSPQAALEEALRATEPTVYVMKDLHHYLGSDHRPADPLLLRLLRGGPAAKANIVPAGVAADDAGNVYISVEYGHKVRRVDPSGIIATFAGRGAAAYGGDIGDGGPAALAGFVFPTDLAVHDGNLYILDESSRRPVSARSTEPGSSPPSPTAADPRPETERPRGAGGRSPRGRCSVPHPAPVPVGLLRPGVGHLGSVGRPG